MRSVTTKHNYQTALQHLILFSFKHPQTNPLPQLNQAHRAIKLSQIRDVKFLPHQPNFSAPG